MKIIYFHLLCLLISFDWSFCYEYMSDERAAFRDVKRNVKSKHLRQKSQNKRWRRQEYEAEKDPVASLDVVSFIQQPDPDNPAFDVIGSDQESNDYLSNEDYAMLSDLEKPFDVAAAAEDHNKNFIVGKSEKDDYSKTFGNSLESHNLKQNIGDNSKRSMEVPFFSSENKGKKQKRRRLFGFSRIGKSKSTTAAILTNYNAHTDGLIKSMPTAVKRSLIERICPMCKRKIYQKKKKEKKVEKQNPIHNSRQYYQQLALPAGMGGKSSQKGYDQFERQKRQNIEFEAVQTTPKDANNMRQLKELEEIEKKVAPSPVFGVNRQR